MANILYNIETLKVFDYVQPGATTTASNFNSDWTLSASDAEKQGFDSRLALTTGNYVPVSLGYTQGGGTLNQEISELEIRADQTSDPVTILIQNTTKTLSLNLLEATPENLAMAFAGKVASGDETTMEFERLPAGLTKSVYIKTKSVDGTYYEIKILKAKIKGNSSISFSGDDATVIPVEMVILAPDASGASPVKIVKKAV
jgi:hypothetical protein